tara:strand:- start:1755 stop:7469 length:5715 start_codon:yes stop_codon:yes gene_type:complete
MRLNRSFIAGIMNKDLDARLIPAGQYRDALNVSVGTSENSDVGAVENTRGNDNVSSLTLAAGAKCIGATTNPEEFKIYWFIASDSKCYIYEYDELNDVVALVLEDDRGAGSQVLNLQLDYLITGVNYYDGYLYWTDDYNPPRMINVGKAKLQTQNNGASWFDEDDINLIVKPPLSAPSITLYNTGNQENNLGERFIQFAYRWKYEDDTYSALSPFSATAFYPGSYSVDYVEHINEAMVNSFNQVRVAFNTGDELVEEIQLVFRDSGKANTYVVENFNKENLGYGNDKESILYFDNNKIYATLEPTQIARLFDNVPLKAKAQEIIGQRLVFGNYVQFRDLTNDGDSIDLNYRLELNSSDAASVNNPMRTFRSDRDYEIGVAYLDDYGRMTTVLTNINNNTGTRGSTIYIPPANSITANDIKVTLSSLPPDWATKYRLFIKQQRGDYYNIFPMFYFQDGAYRWFRLSEADRDKFDVGDYLICKSDANGATQSDTEYKVLEIKVQDKGFLGGGEPEGLYFKIGVDNGEFNETDLVKLTSEAKGAIGLGVDVVDVIENLTGGYQSPDMAPFEDTNIYYHYQNINNPIPYLRNANNKDDLHIIYPNSSPHINAFTKDERVYIKIISPNTNGVDRFEAYDIEGNTLVGGTNITGGNQYIPHLQGYAIKFQSTTGHSVGDRWVINARAKLAPGNNTTLGGSYTEVDTGVSGVGWSAIVFPLVPVFGYDPNSPYGGWAIVNDEEWGINATDNSISDNTASAIDRPIEAGAEIRFNFEESNPASGNIDNGTQIFSSSRRYDNIEEWFYEDGIYLKFKQKDQTGTNQKSKNVFFRRCYDWHTKNVSGLEVSKARLTHSGPDTPVRMIIQGYGTYKNKQRNIITVNFQIIQSENPIIFETDPKEVDADVFHEAYRTFDITGGYHQGNISNQVAGSPAVISLNDFNTPAFNMQNNNFNAYCFGNGLESNRIKDDFNADTLEYSPRVSTVIEDYKQERKKDSIAWSSTTSRLLNRFNEFNLSTANFKDLDISFGSIQKIYSRDTNLVVLQEDKISQVPWNKNILVSAAGAIDITQSSDVAGTQISYAGEYGISNNPESFASWGNTLYFTDVRRGCVLTLGGNGLFEISGQGMSDYFKDLFTDDPRTFNIGTIDPYSEKYVLAHTATSFPCAFQVEDFVSGNRIVKNNGGQSFNLNITADVAWAVSLVDTGGGTGWATVSPATGSGDGGVNITLTSNGSTSARSMTVRFTACAVNTDITLRQEGIASKVKRETVIVTNPKDEGQYNKPAYDYATNPGSAIDIGNYISGTGNVRDFDSSTDYPPSSGIPTPGDTVEMRGPVTSNGGLNKNFEPGLNNKMYYLVTDTVYGIEDTTNLITAASPIAPTYDAPTESEQATFIYNRPADETYLYMIWDYTDSIDAGTTGTSSAKQRTYHVNLNYGANVGKASFTYDANSTPNRFVLKYNNVIIADTGYVGLNSTANYNALIAAGVAAEDINLVSPYGGTINNGTGTIEFSKYSSSITTAELTVYAPLATEDGWSGGVTAATLTSFTIFTTGRETSALACSDTAATTYYHNGVAADPVAGDTIYTDSAGATPMSGGNLYYALGTGVSNTWVYVDNNGGVLENGSCACAEVAIPVIDTTTIELVEGMFMNYGIQVTNNPTSWAVISGCNNYSLYGGSEGAVFSGTHCDVAEAKVVTVGARNTVHSCFSGATVSQLSGSSDATFSISGVCMDGILPPGLNFEGGFITGIPSISGEYSITLTATNCFGTSVQTTLIISVTPEGLFKFKMDANQPESTTTAACALTAEYDFFFHDGAFTYPILNDRIYVITDSIADLRAIEDPTVIEATFGRNYAGFNGQSKWYLMDNNTLIKIARDGRVIDTYECIAGSTKVTEAGAGGFAPGTTKTTEGGSNKTLE